MLQEETVRKMNDMKLHAMARSFRERLSRPDHGDLSVSEFMGFIVDDEWMDRENKKISSRLRVARFKDESASMEAVDYVIPRKLKKQQILELAQNHWVEKHQNVIFIGPSGSGKSYIAQALGNHLCRAGYSVGYYRMSKLISSLTQARADGSYMRLLKRIARHSVLILDDMGVGKLTDVHRTDILELLEDRYDVGSTIITSQLGVPEWHEYFGGDTVADAIMDRIVHNAHRIDLNSKESVRKLRNGLPDSEKSEK